MKRVGIIYINQTPRFTKKQLERASNIFDNVGQIILASGAIQPLFHRIDDEDILVILSALGASIAMWFISLWLARLSE